MRFERTCVAATLAVSVMMWAAVTAAAIAPTVAIVKSSSVGPFEEATSTVVDALRKKPPEPELLVFDLKGSSEGAAAILTQVRQADPRLIVTVGSLATSVVLHEKWSVPIVFSMVLFPEMSGFVPTAERALTGSSLDIPPERSLELLRRLLPAAKRIGVLYNPTETGRVVEKIRAAATKAGLQLEAKVVEQSADAMSALEQLMSNVDVVWALADSHVFTPQTTPALILSTLRQRIPLFGLSPGQVRSGALLALSCDYADIGRQTAEQVQRILAGTNAAEVPVTVPRKLLLSLNLRSADHLGVRVDAGLVGEAAEVIR